LDFLNTDSHNHDTYTLKIALRRLELDDEEEFRVKLTLISNVLAAPALEDSWLFKNGEYEVASRVYHRICDEVDDVKTDFDRSMTPISTLAALLREAIKRDPETSLFCQYYSFPPTLHGVRSGPLH